MRALELACTVLHTNDVTYHSVNMLAFYTIADFYYVRLFVVELRTEIDQLRSQLHGQSSSMSVLVDTSSSVEVLSLKKQLQESERLVAEATLTWKERLDQAERRKQEEVDKLKVGRGRAEP